MKLSIIYRYSTCVFILVYMYLWKQNHKKRVLHNKFLALCLHTYIFLFSLLTGQCIIPIKLELLSYFITVYTFYTVATCCTKNQYLPLFYAVTKTKKDRYRVMYINVQNEDTNWSITNIRLSMATKRYYLKAKYVQ